MSSFNPANVTNPNLSGSDPIGQLRDAMANDVISMYANKASLYTAGLTVSKPASNGEKSVPFVRYGRTAHNPARKAVTGVPVDQGPAPQDTVLVPVVASEWQRAAIDQEINLDTAIPIIQPHTQATFSNMMEQWDRRFLRTLTLNSQAAAVSGISSAPASVTITSSGATQVSSFCPITTAGGDALLTKIAELRLAMIDLEEGLDEGSLRLIVRPAVLASIRQSNRFMSRDYNSEANVPAAYVGNIEGMQVLSVHESLWPKTNITIGTGTANDTDSNYLVDARFASTAGAPGLFIVAVGNETGPVAESSAPNRQGLEIRPYLDDETDTLFIQTRQRYCMRRFIPSRSGVLWFKG